MKHLKDDVAQAFQGSLSEYFSSGINEAHSFGEAMPAAGHSRSASAMQRIAGPRSFALQITDWLFGGFSGGGKVAAKKAAGGYISGPGTGTSDSIRRVALDGRVRRARGRGLPARDAAAPRAINAGMQRIQVEPHRLAPMRFADGGIAGAAAGKASVDGRVNRGARRRARGPGGRTPGLQQGRAAHRRQEPASDPRMLGN